MPPFRPIRATSKFIVSQFPSKSKGRYKQKKEKNPRPSYRSRPGIEVTKSFTIVIYPVLSSEQVVLLYSAREPGSSPDYEQEVQLTDLHPEERYRIPYARAVQLFLLSAMKVERPLSDLKDYSSALYPAQQTVVAEFVVAPHEA